MGPETRDKQPQDIHPKDKPKGIFLIEVRADQVLNFLMCLGCLTPVQPRFHVMNGMQTIVKQEEIQGPPNNVAGMVIL